MTLEVSDESKMWVIYQCTSIYTSCVQEQATRHSSISIAAILLADKQTPSKRNLPSQLVSQRLHRLSNLLYPLTPHSAVVHQIYRKL